MNPRSPRPCRDTFQRIWRDDQGATAIEYGLIVALIALSIVAAARGLGNQLGSTFNAASSGMTAPSS